MGQNILYNTFNSLTDLSIISRNKKCKRDGKKSSNSRVGITCYLIFQFLLISHFVSSQNIAGNYYSVETKCKLGLKINSANHFVFDLGNGKTIKGNVKISKADNAIYLDFNEISSMLEKDTIYIQNSGNSMNQYVNFKKCNEKYIRLVKRGKVKNLETL